MANRRFAVRKSSNGACNAAFRGDYDVVRGQGYDNLGTRESWTRVKKSLKTIISRPVSAGGSEGAIFAQLPR